MRFAEDAIKELVCTDGVGRPIHIWQGEQVDVVFVAVHGGLAHGGDWVQVGQYFKPLGYATVALDQHGHDGKQRVLIPGFEIFLDDLALLLSWTRTQYPDKPIVLLGHSMGGLILTHYGLRRLTQPDAQILGFILSSPYYVNAIKVPWLVEQLSGLLAAVAPGMAVPLADFTDELTHDPAITARHKQDAADNVRATEASARFARELLLAQNYIPDNIGRWSHSLLTFVAGQDKLADSQATERLLARISPELVTVHHYPDNYHENFNETNREELFSIMHEWVQGQRHA